MDDETNKTMAVLEKNLALARAEIERLNGEIVELRKSIEEVHAENCRLADSNRALEKLNATLQATSRERQIPGQTEGGLKI